MMNRKIHRWTSFPIAVFMLIVALSGVVLQYDEMGGSKDGAGGDAVPAVLPDNEAISALVAQALSAANAAQPNFVAQSLTVSPGKVVLNGPGGRGAASITYEAAKGKATYAPPPPQSLHGIMIGLHTGKTAGLIGLVIVMAAGIILSILSITGFIIYLEMWRRRRKARKSGLFW